MLRVILFMGVVVTYAIFAGESSVQRPFRVSQIPNGTKFSCANCHVNASGGGTRNNFGQTVESSFLDASGNVIWNPEIAHLDSDNDGYTNGQELGDPFGIWAPGHDAPGSPDQVSNPGDPLSVPSFSPNDLSLNIHFQNMLPHVGQQLRVRVIRQKDLSEVARARIDEIPSAEFDVSFMNVFTPGESYWVDFFADFNGNGYYDAPPTDHAWRISANDIQSDTSITFSHNTRFADIRWPYQVTVAFSGMSPHQDQVLQMRVVEQSSGREVGRASTVVTQPDFNLSVVGVERGGSYNIDFFADVNDNGLYDPPGTDHAWRIEALNIEDDTTFAFSHNTNFTDIEWKYAVTLNLMDMTPHLHQLFEARVVSRSGTEEINRVLVDSIGVPNFQITMGGLELNNDYNLDFYADFNGNRRYDPPPTDHAWRIEFVPHTGDTTIHFTHNTNFTDINYPSTGIVPVPGFLPETFSLSQNFPNPFNPSTQIAFSIPVVEMVKLEIFNATGAKIATLFQGVLPAGKYVVSWDGTNAQGNPVPAGIYFYRLTAGNFQQTRRMVLLK